MAACAEVEKAATTSVGVAVLNAMPAVARPIERVEAVDAILRALDQRPRQAAVRRAQQAFAVVGVGRIIGVARAGDQHRIHARLHRQRADGQRRHHAAASIVAEDRQRVRQRHKLAAPSGLPRWSTSTPRRPWCRDKPYCRSDRWDRSQSRRRGR